MPPLPTAQRGCTTGSRTPGLLGRRHKRTLGSRLSPLVVLAAALMMAGPVAAAEIPGEVKLSLESYQELVNGVSRSASAAAWSRGSVSVSVDVPRRVATVTVNASVKVAAEGVAIVALVPADVILTNAQINGSNAKLTVRSGWHTARFGEDDARETSVRLTYLVSLRTSDSGANVAAIPLPPLPSSDFSMSGVQAPVETWPALAGGSATSGKLGATAAVVVRWGVGAGGYSIASSDYVSVPDTSGDGVDITATFAVDVTGASASIPVASTQVAVIELKEGNKPLVGTVNGDWHHVKVVGKGRHTLTVRFRQLVDRSKGQPSVRLRLTGAPIQRIKASVPGNRSVTFDPVVPVTSQTTTGENPLTTATANLPPVGWVTLAWTEALAKPEDDKKINAETYQLIRIEEGVIRSKVHIRYDIIRGKTKELPVAIPEGVVLYKAHGPQIEKWPIYAATEDAPRQARIILSSDRTGTYELVLELQQAYKKDTTEVRLPVVKPLDVAYQTGAVALFDGDKVGFGTGVPEGQTFTKGGENDLPSDIRQQQTDKPSQVFRHVEAPSDITAPIEAAKVREVRFDTKTNTLYTVKEGRLRGQALVQVEIRTGRRDSLIVALPSEGVQPLNWQFPSKAKDPEVAEGAKVPEGYTGYELKFTQALEGAIQIDVEFEMLLDAKVADVPLPNLRIMGAAVESGAIGIVADPGIEVNPVPDKDLRLADSADLPNAIRLRTTHEGLMGYTYSRSNWSVQLGIKRHEVIKTLEAIATQAWLDTIVFSDGHLKTAATYVIRNEQQKRLRLETPEGSTVLKVFAGGQAVKANKDGGALTIRLPENQTTVVTVVYEVRDSELGFFGRRTMIAPKVNLRVSDIQWLVRTPVEFAVFGVTADYLKEKHADDYRPPGNVQADGVRTLTSLSNPDEYAMRLFTVEELRAKGDAIEVTLSFASTPGSWVALLLSLIALILLIIVVRRRVAQEPLGASGFLALLLGVGALVLKASGWGIGIGEALLGVAILTAVGIWTWRSREEDGD